LRYAKKGAGGCATFTLSCKMPSEVCLKMTVYLILIYFNGYDLCSLVVEDHLFNVTELKFIISEF
jgi:hypothetical protein